MFQGSRPFRLRSLPIAAVRQTWRAQSRLTPSRLAQTSEPLREQTVRFQSPGLTPRRFATFAIYTTCFVGYLYWVIPDFSIEITDLEEEFEEEDGQEEGDEEEGEEEWTDSDSTFIPLTWATKLPRTFYKGSDPEWQEFVKIAQNQPKHKQIHNELVTILFQGVQAHPGLQRQLGKDVKVGKYWLDINFPDGPPQEYSRKGIEIGDDYVAYSTQRITQEQQDRTARVLWPAATLGGVYAFSKTLLSFQYIKLKQALGFGSKADPGSAEEKQQKLLQLLQVMEAQEAHKKSQRLNKAQTNPDGGDVGSSSSTTTTTTTSTSDMASSTPSPAPQDSGRHPTHNPSSASASASPADASKQRWFMPSVSLPGAPMEQVVATTMFAHALAKNRVGKKPEPPRGTFVVQGLVQIKGARAVITFDVNAFYDPKLGRYVAVHAQPRSLKRWRQAPRGGM